MAAPYVWEAWTNVTIRKVGNIFVDLEDLADTVDLTEIYGDEKVVCPWHNDSNPSLQVYPDHVYCYACGQWQDPIGFVQAMEKLSFDNAIKFLWKRKHSTSVRKRVKASPIEPDEVRKWHDKLLSFSNSAWPWHWLAKRGLGRQVVQALGIGWNGREYTIPHYANGKVLNVKFRVHPDKQGDYPKYRSLPGHTFDYLYPWDYFRKHYDYSLVHLTEGELDAAILLQAGMPALSLPSGANTKWSLWVPTLRAFSTVRLCLDQDRAGLDAVNELAKKGVTGRSVLDMLPNTRFEHVTWDASLWGKDVTDARNTLLPRLRRLMNAP